MAYRDPAVMAQLHSVNQRDLAVTLSKLMIDQEQNEWVRTYLEKIRDIVWDNEKVPPAVGYEAQKRRATLDKMRIHEYMQSAPDEASKKRLAEDYTRLGHLYEIAGHIARENYFLEKEGRLKAITKPDGHSNNVPSDKDVVPGGIHDMLYHNAAFSEASLEKTIALLNTPVSEYIFTQHPTNTNTLESMRLQRDIAHELEALVRADIGLKSSDGFDTDLNLDRLKDTIGKFMEQPVISETNFTAKDETDIVINYLSNAYHDLDGFYEATERGLHRKFAEYDDAKRRELDLKLRFGSWGSAGDKDGNANIKSENTLEAIALHKLAAVRLFAADIEKLAVKPKELELWVEQLKDAEKALDTVVKDMEAVRKGSDIALSKEQFKDCSGRVQATADTLGPVDDFIKSLDAALDNPATGAAKEGVLSLRRKAKTFGFSLGKIEYRETAEEYERVLAFLLERKEVEQYSFAPEAKNFIDAYKAIANERALASREKRKEDKSIIEPAEEEIQRSIVRIMNDPKAQAALTALANGFMEEADATKLRNYKDEKLGDASIAYHTIRRMELARDFDGMITHNVLAEAKGTHSLLEALAMQMTTTQKDGTRAMLNIVPLFEEADTMAKIPDVIRGGLENDAYRKHINALKDHYNDNSLTQQIQIAHSDNARRAGAIASRGIIHEGHRAAREAIEEYNAKHTNAPVKLEFFEGGSFSDSYRNGVRAITAMLRDFGLADKFKATFQGGDLLNYFNQSTSMKRLALRNLVQQAEIIANDNVPNGKHTPMEAAIVDGISDLQHQYNEGIYDHPANPLGIILHALDYRAQAAAGSAGTRLNRNAALPEGEDVTGVDPKNMRTIGFSEALQHGNIHPSCIGTDKLVDVLRQKFAADPKARRELEDSFEQYRAKKEMPLEKRALDDSGQLTSAGLQFLYKEGSASFKDAIDKMAYSLINTRVQAFTDQLERYQQGPKNKKEREEKEKLAAEGKKFVGTRDETLDKAFHMVISEYDDAARLVYRALSGKDIDIGMRWKLVENPIKRLDQLIHHVRELPALEHLEMHHHKHGFLDGLDVIEREAGLQNSRLTHNARDTVYHGRTFTADDPNYGKAIVDEKAQSRGAENSLAG